MTRRNPISLRSRRIFGLLLSAAAVAVWVILNPISYDTAVIPADDPNSTAIEPLGVSVSSDGADTQTAAAPLAAAVLEKLEIKGRAPKTNYERTQFYKNWPTVNGCSLRQLIIKREFGDSAVLDGCNVISGSYTEPYTGVVKTFSERSQISSGVQIDHVVALSDAWQKGAQNLSADERYNLATDPLNLLAVDSQANQQKSDGDAATWLPSNKAFRCQYVARQISVKYKYHLWLAQAEHDTMVDILKTCPNEPAVGVDF